MIKTIEVICRPCHKCEELLEKIPPIMDIIQSKYQIKIKYKLKHNKNIYETEKYGHGSTETPLLIINGSVAFSGNVPTEYYLRMKLDEIQKNVY